VNFLGRKVVDSATAKTPRSSSTLPRPGAKPQESAGRRGVETRLHPAENKRYPLLMPVLGLEAEDVRRELENVLKSPGFARNDRQSRFLRFIVERELEGRHEELKESVIGIEVFGRTPDYDTKLDPIVRTEARRLRARLSEYYESAGAGDGVIIDLPKGGYVPVVRLAAHVSRASTSGPVSTSSRSITSRLVPLALAGTAVALAAVAWIRFGPTRPTQIAKSPAYDVYLRARAAETHRALSGAEVSLELFEQAIAKDAFFAPGYAGAAAMEAARSGFDRFAPAERADMIAKGWVFANEAMRLDSRLPDSYDAVAMMQARAAQWIRAEYNFRRAIELAPSDPLWHDHFAMFLLMPLGRIDEAIEQLRTSEGLDPRSPQMHHALMMALRDAGRFADAEAHCQTANEKNDQQMSECWADTLYRQGRIDEVVPVLEEIWANRLLVMGAQCPWVSLMPAPAVGRMPSGLPRSCRGRRVKP
jgi:hypothetical protein